jgi:hypothetical protein
LLLYGKKTMTPTAHIQTALEAACKFGRKQYDYEQSIELSLKRALAAYHKFMGEIEINPEFQPVKPAIGGGMTIAGKIKWLLENEGAMTSPAIAFELNAKVETIRNVAHKLCLAGVIQRKSRGVFEPIKKGVMASMVAIVLLLSGTRSMAQRGEGTTFNIQQPTLNAQVIALPTLAPTPKKTNILTWNHIPGVTYRVQVGAARGNYTNSFTVSTNQFPLTNGLAYAVWSVQGAIESAVPALWPSNRVGELWLTGMGTNLTGGTNIVRLAKFTNSPPGNMQFWGVANVTTGWE